MQYCTIRNASCTCLDIGYCIPMDGHVTPRSYSGKRNAAQTPNGIDGGALIHVYEYVFLPSSSFRVHVNKDHILFPSSCRSRAAASRDLSTYIAHCLTNVPPFIKKYRSTPQGVNIPGSAVPGRHISAFDFVSNVDRIAEKRHSIPCNSQSHLSLLLPFFSLLSMTLTQSRHPLAAALCSA